MGPGWGLPMRASVVGIGMWLLLCSPVHAAPQGEMPPATAVISAGQGQPVHMATYRDSAGIPVPAGACAAVVDRHVWVLPCSDPRVSAYRRAAAVAAARTAKVSHQVEAVGILGVAAVAGAAAEWFHRRQLAQGRRV